jgi:hypothetical protein
MPWSEAVLAGNLLDFEDGYSAIGRTATCCRSRRFAALTLQLNRFNMRWLDRRIAR